MSKAILETLKEMADWHESFHREDSSWWDGYIAGFRRATALVEDHLAKEEE